MQESLLLRFLYNTCAGRLLLKLLVNRSVSVFAGRILDSKISIPLINYYIKKYNIDMDEYVDDKYESFNDFFIRTRKSDGLQSYDDDTIISPCDGMLSICCIDSDTRLNIKNSSYSISELLQDEADTVRFADGCCLIFRLAPHDYHRYSFPASGTILRHKKINGVLHCVRPVACDRYPVFVQNSREYTIVENERIGRVVQMEVGALLVGRIHNHEIKRTVHQGQEKGYFEFGGSTVILLFEKNKVSIEPKLKLLLDLRGEVKIKKGTCIGTCLC